MADNYSQALNFRKSELTGNTENSLDAIDVTRSDFKEYSACFVTLDSGNYSLQTIMYEARLSGATPDGFNVIQPANYTGSMRWHLAGASGGSLSTYWLPFTKWEDGIVDRNIFPIRLQTGEFLEIFKIDLPMDGGGSDSDFTLKFYEVETDTVLATTTAGNINRGNPIVKSNAGNTIEVQITNNTGSQQRVAIYFKIAIKG